MLLLNAFSLNMLPPANPVNCTFRELPPDEAKSILSGRMESAVGHAETANILSTILGESVPCNRATVTLPRDGEAVVAQYIGPRLPEGATALPEGAKIKFYLIKILC